jgi:hypothetical protein
VNDRQDQMMMSPVLDVRVHEDYLAFVRQTSSTANPRTFAPLLDVASTRMVIRVPVASAPSTVVKRMEPRPALLRTLAFVECKKEDKMFKCFSCQSVAAAASNFCSGCGQATSVSQCMSDHVFRMKGGGEPYLSYKSPPKVTHFKDGSCLLATVVKDGKKLFLICNADKTEVKWTE